MKFFIKIFLSLVLLTGIICVIACKKETREVCPSGGNYERGSFSEEDCKLAAEIRGYKYYCYGYDGCYLYSD